MIPPIVTLTTMSPRIGWVFGLAVDVMESVTGYFLLGSAEKKVETMTKLTKCIEIMHIADTNSQL